MTTHINLDNAEMLHDKAFEDLRAVDSAFAEILSEIILIKLVESKIALRYRGANKHLATKVHETAVNLLNACHEASLQS